MIIPIRCFTCGKVVAHKWQEYRALIQEEFLGDASGGAPSSQTPVQVEKHKKSAAGEFLDANGFDRACCRRMFLTHVDMLY